MKTRKNFFRVKDMKWQKLRIRIIERDNYQCVKCEEKQLSKLSAHHIKPRSQGGKNVIRNLITLCLRCHNFVEMLWDEGERRYDALFAKVEKSQDDGLIRQWGVDGDNIVARILN